MFLSYTVMPAFVFTVLLNFFYLCSPVDSKEKVTTFETCEKCLSSPCHKHDKGTCTYRNNCYECLLCSVDDDKYKQYHSTQKCNEECKGDSKCVCDGACIKCIKKDDANLKNLHCKMPDNRIDKHCKLIPYNNKSSAKGSSKNDPSEKGKQSSKSEKQPSGNDPTAEDSQQSDKNSANDDSQNSKLTNDLTALGISTPINQLSSNDLAVINVFGNKPV